MSEWVRVSEIVWKGEQECYGVATNFSDQRELVKVNGWVRERESEEKAAEQSERENVLNIPIWLLRESVCTLEKMSEWKRTTTR